RQGPDPGHRRPGGIGGAGQLQAPGSPRPWGLACACGPEPVPTCPGEPAGWPRITPQVRRQAPLRPRRTSLDSPVTFRFHKNGTIPDHKPELVPVCDHIEMRAGRAAVGKLGIRPGPVNAVACRLHIDAVGPLTGPPAVRTFRPAIVEIGLPGDGHLARE